MSKAPGPYAPPPYRQVAGGGVFFKVLPGIRGLATAWIEATRLYTDLGRIAHPAAPAKRALLLRHIRHMEQAILAGEIEVAEITDEAVRQRIAATQVRPDNPNGPKMRDSIYSRPIPFSPLPGFSVGQVDIGALNVGATGVSGKPYWPSQEWGYAGNVGRTLRGYFQPGQSRASSSESRVHPIFRTQSGGGLMTIKNPIEERAFLRSGVMVGAIARQRIWNRLEGEAVAEVTRILTLGGPGASRGRP